MLSRFVNAKIPATIELVEAICLEFRLPMPIFFPRSLVEALAMTVVKEKYDGHQPEIKDEPAPIASIDRGARKASVSPSSARTEQRTKKRARPR